MSTMVVLDQENSCNDIQHVTLSSGEAFWSSTALANSHKLGCQLGIQGIAMPARVANHLHIRYSADKRSYGPDTVKLPAQDTAVT